MAPTTAQARHRLTTDKQRLTATRTIWLVAVQRISKTLCNHWLPFT